MVPAMNGAFDRVARGVRLVRWAISGQGLGRVGVPAMAVAGIGAIVAVLVGLQCGGLDRCFTGQAPVAVAAVGLANAAPGAAPVPEIAMTVATVTPEPVVPEAVQRARRADDMIGATFVALAVDDAGWLAGAAANAANDAETYAEGDGAGPPPSDGETAAEAVAAAAIDEAPVQPLQRPERIDVTAFADEAPAVAPAVKAAAQQKLAEVQKPKAAAEPAARTEIAARPEASKPAPAVDPKPTEPAKADAAVGDSRTISGSGVNVRSGPGKSNDKLFALAGGEKVTVVEDQRGWLKITDDQGRAGWLYKTYLD